MVHHPWASSNVAQDEDGDRPERMVVPWFEKAPQKGCNAHPCSGKGNEREGIRHIASPHVEERAAVAASDDVDGVKERKIMMTHCRFDGGGAQF